MNSNPGFLAEEIQKVKEKCQSEGKSFIFIEDDDLPIGNDKEMAHIQFIGNYNGREVVYDAMLYTLQLHYSSVIYEEAEREVMNEYPLYVPIESRDETYQPNEQMDEEVEMMILEVIEELEETDEIKVSEFIQLDEQFEFGIGIEAALYVPTLEDDVIENFIQNFNNGTFKADETMYSFKNEEN